MLAPVNSVNTSSSVGVRMVRLLTFKSVLLRAMATALRAEELSDVVIVIVSSLLRPPVDHVDQAQRWRAAAGSSPSASTTMTSCPMERLSSLGRAFGHQPTLGR